MWIESLSDNTFLIFIHLSREPQAQYELEVINEIVSCRDDCNVVISLYQVEMLTSLSLRSLIQLHNLLSEQGRMLVLCRAGSIIRDVFGKVGFDNIFNLVDDAYSALTVIEDSEHQKKPEPAL